MFGSFDRLGAEVRSTASKGGHTADGFVPSSAVRIAFLILYLSGAVTWATLAQAQDSFVKDATEAPVTQTSKKIPPFTTKQKYRFYWQTTYTPFALTGPVLGAAVTQWTTRNPPEWGQGSPGYGRRVLSGYSRQVIANTIGLGVMSADGEDPRHYPTGKSGIWKRGLYAARETFISRRVSGGEMPDYSRIVGAYAAGFASNAWYPARYSNTKDALYRGSTALASDIIWQEFKEFWPDIRHKLRGR